MLKKIISAFGLLSLIAVPNLAMAQSNPEIQWKIQKYPHFDLIFDANHQDLARAYGESLEEIDQSLAAVFSAHPEKTLLVLNDRTDQTNAYATPLPTSTIVVFPVLPGPLESIYEHGNWPRELVMHEYVHILSFEPRRGIVKNLKSIFGSIITPNLLLPRWWLEGLAVDLETRTSQYGRLRAKSQDASLRSYFVDQSLLKMSVADMNEVSIPTWPGGARPYLFGSLMWSTLMAMDAQSPERLAQAQGGRMPYFINGPPEAFYGKNYVQVFYSMMQDLERRLSLQIQSLKNLKPTQGIEFKSDALEAFSPQISPDGLKMIYIARGDNGKRSIKILVRKTQDQIFTENQEMAELNQRLNESPSESRIPKSDGPPSGTISRLSWMPDSQSFVYDLIEDHNKFQKISNLYAFDLRTLKAQKLTNGIRAREPQVSPSGSQVVYVELGPGTTSLSLLDLKSSKTQIVFKDELLSTVSFPSFISENEIVFTLKSRTGAEKMLKLSLKDQSTQEILTEFPEARLSQKVLPGLLFTSTRNGIPNLYLATNLQELKQAQALTHSLTMVTTATLDPVNEDLYYTELTSKGLQLRRLPKSAWPTANQSLPKVKALFEDRYPNRPQEPPPVQTNLPPTEDYSPYGYLWPQYWLPSFSFSSSGAYLGASFSGQDPVGLHSYSFFGGYDTQLQRGNYSLLYSNQVFVPTISFLGLDYHIALGLSNYDLHKQEQLLGWSWDLWKIDTNLDLHLGWDWKEQELTGVSKSYQTGPIIGFYYSNFTQGGDQISPEAGYGVSLTSTSFLRDSSKEGFHRLAVSAVKYMSQGLPDHHVFMFKFRGQWIEENVSFPNYEASTSYPLLTGTLYPEYLMRGYINGQFLGKSIGNLSLEYRFPLFKIYSGADTTPLYIKRIHGAVVADGLQTDGYAYLESLTSNSNFRYEKVNPWQSFWNAGLELKADLTLGYHFPITMYFGTYWGLESRYNKDNPRYGLGILL